MKLAAALVLSLLVAACGLVPKQQDGDILVIGDSVMAWNRSDQADVGHIIAKVTHRRVVSRAALGAQVRVGPLGSLVGLNIPDQLSSGRWNWVVMNGGANDLGFSCGCTQCDGEIDALISPDGTGGDIPRLIENARAGGAKVLWMGYYQAPHSTSFKGCRPGLVEIERRIATYAGARDSVFFVDAEDFFDPGDQNLLGPDNTHPSAAGSAVIGRTLAQTITRNSTR
ncbi:SGNH/GDSL hydrolase family protein [Frigidibacter sp. MR17.14]|uniref:SGNH/GDSL hydrolase family protein n=1 Tax=Frigidibacter sp. MR17.14 TaxID=3126509 RepID=UPI0030131ADE